MEQQQFIVSARKYRPDNFRSVVGQEHITSTLLNAIARNHLSHAYLFCGPRGVGKTTCARIIAKTINCLNPTSTFEACDECESCRAFAENASFNIYELDAASNNSVDNIRQLNEQVRIPPQVGRYSIYIIDEVHMLSTAAFNAFLKTLEEPPTYVKFILATTEKHKILPTIISRCQVYEFKHISVEDVVGYLKYISSEEGVTYDEESLNIIAQKAGGCMRDALSMFDKVVTFCDSKLTLGGVSSALNLLDYDTYFSFVELLNRANYNDALLSLDAVLKRGFDSITFLSGLSRHLRDVLVAKDDRTLQLLGASAVLAARYRKQAQECSAHFLFNTLDIFANAEASLKFSLNQRLSAELAILKVCSNVSPVKQEVAEPIKTEAQTIEKPADISSNRVESNVVTTKPTEEPTKTVETPKEPINNEPQAKPKGLSSSLGIPRLNTLTAVNNSDEQAKSKEEDIVVENFRIDETDIDKALAGCKLFASKIQARNPRVALAFEDAKIVDGKLIIPVPNKILQDEIYAKKSQTCNYLSKCAEMMIYDFEVLVEEAIYEDKKILIRNEDKYKHLLDENSKLHDLTEKIGLEFK